MMRAVGSSSMVYLAWIVGGLLTLFGGRQAARAAHFLLATYLVLFVIVHIAMVVLSGPINNMRSMITGRYRIGEARR